MLALYQHIKNCFSRQEGQTMVEYALILVLVSIVAMGILGALGVNVQGVFQTVSDTLGG
ncbi:Flp family type IVb pilin [candidate division KSB1 bacterium]|nr:Flp family type IVb pilin [candidate division KSB1 bacterium]